MTLFASLTRQKTLKDYLIVLFGSGFSRGLAFFNSIIIARLLGPVDFGKFSIFFIISVLTWLFAQSFDSTYVRFAGVINSSKAKNEFLKISIFLKLIYFLFVLIISFPLASFLAKYFFHKTEIKSLLILAMISGVFQSFLMTIASIFQEKEKFTTFSILYSFYTVTIFVLLIVFYFSMVGFSLNGVIAIHFGTSIVIGLISLYLLFNKKIKQLFPLNRDSLRDSFSLGKWILGVTVLSYIFPRLDFLFLGRYSGFNSLGIYSVAQQIIMFISVMTGSLSNVFLPKASRALESPSAFKIFKKEALLISSIINFFVCLLGVFATFLIKLLYGEQYILASSITRILLIGWFAAIIYLPFSALYYVLNDSLTRFILEITKFVIASLLLYFLVPTKGMIGAAMAISLTLILDSVFSLYLLKGRVRNVFRKIDS
jgi:O-antigen/teichoic acid export membrane protein